MVDAATCSKWLVYEKSVRVKLCKTMNYTAFCNFFLLFSYLFEKKSSAMKIFRKRWWQKVTQRPDKEIIQCAKKREWNASIFSLTSCVYSSSCQRGTKEKKNRVNKNYFVIEKFECLAKRWKDLTDLAYAWENNGRQFGLHLFTRHDVFL